MESLFDLSGLRKEIKDLEDKTLKPDFWDDSDRAQDLISKLNDLKSTDEDYTTIYKDIEDALCMVELMKEEDTSELLQEADRALARIEKKLDRFNIENLLDGEYDRNDALVSIHAGAGGLEAQDWAEMIFRMYDRWIASRGFEKVVTSYNSDTEGGIKSVGFRVKGKNAYGLLKGEKGVHRLVRISPFDAAKKRHTSFASVDVIPELKESTKIDIDPNDLKIDTYRSSGAGGQHVNTTDSAVRITHISTGLVVTCQNERSQILNRETAMRILYSKLLQIAQEEKREKIEDIQGNYGQIKGGNQIRSYVFHPYQMVKDHRTNYEVGDIGAVMDGDLDPFISEYLNMNCGKTN